MRKIYVSSFWWKSLIVEMILIVFAVIFAGLLTWFGDTDFLAIIAPLWMFSLVLLSITTSFVLIPVLVMFSFFVWIAF